MHLRFERQDLPIFFFFYTSLTFIQFPAGCLKRFNIMLGSNRDNSGRVKVDLRVPITVLDVVEIGGILEGGVIPIKVL